MKTVHEVSRITGISVRTLHYYDEIGLLPPDRITEAGYRLYGEESLKKLRSILLFRELQFPLKEIKAILSAPGFDARDALEKQFGLLQLQKDRLERLLEMIREMMKEGMNDMDFSAFDETEIRKYKEEAQKRWGHTDAYKESEKRERGRSPEENKALADGMMAIFTEMGRIRDTAPDSPEALALAAGLQSYITDYYYPCTREILQGLGQMYTGDERFRNSIDGAGGPGTADFAARVIEAFCQRS